MVELVPEAEKAIKKSTWLLGQNHGLYEELVARVFNELIESKSGQSVVYKTKLFAFDNWQTLLWELLTPFNFAGNQMSSIANAMQNEPGRVFFSETHRLSIDRETIEIIALDQVNEPETLYLYNESAIAKADFRLTFESLEKSVKFTIDPDPHIAYLDKDMIEFPLAVRTWQYGDRFRPLGLKGSKLLSDYFIDSGLSRHQKEQIRLLCNANGDIMWVIGLRIDHRYRIRPGTKNILKIRHLVD